MQIKAPITGAQEDLAVTEPVNSDSRIIAAVLLDALLKAMPFVEDALYDDVYKAGRVRKTLDEIKKAISMASNQENQQ